MNIEPLESRIAPALVFVSPTTATYTDVDGDLVTVKFSKPALTAVNVAGVLEVSPAGLVGGEQLTRIDLNSNQAVKGSSITVTANPQDVTADTVPDGDGWVNVGWIDATGIDLGAVSIKGDLGRIDAGDATTADGGLKSLSVQSMGIFGTSTQIAGDLVTTINGALGSLKVAGSVKGPRIEVIGGVDGKLGPVTIGGSLIGTGAEASSWTSSAGAMGAVKIGGNIEGGDITAAGTLSNTGVIEAGRVASLFVGGSIIAGFETGAGNLIDSGAVRVSFDIGAITIKGSIIGNFPNPVLITASGQLTPGATTDIAIKSLTVGGRVEWADILAGYGNNDATFGVNADAQIGKVTVGGDWVTSSAVAGVNDGGNGFGNANDAALSGAGITDTALVSKIASITIKSLALGTPPSVNAADHHGFVAQQISSFKVGATTFPLTAGAFNDLAGKPVGTTGDLRVREVAL